MSTQASHPLDATQDAMALIGRILVAVLFVPAGWGKLMGFANTVGYIASKGVPLPEVAAAIAIFFELGCGLALLFGWKTRWAALGLAIFTIVITPIFHPFWADPSQKLNFWKNLAITGGLLGFASFGGGAFSLDGRSFAARRHVTA